MLLGGRVPWEDPANPATTSEQDPLPKEKTTYRDTDLPYNINTSNEYITLNNRVYPPYSYSGLNPNDEIKDLQTADWDLLERFHAYGALSSEQYTNLVDQIARDFGTDPDSDPIILTTYKPFSHYLPGHSRLRIPLSRRAIYDSGLISKDNYLNESIGNPYIVTDRLMGDFGYNLITNNCANATFYMLQNTLDIPNKDFGILTTPWGVRNYVQRVTGKNSYLYNNENDGVSRLYIPSKDREDAYNRSIRAITALKNDNRFYESNRLHVNEGYYTGHPLKFNTYK